MNATQSLHVAAARMRGEALARLEKLVMAESPSGDIDRLARVAQQLATSFDEVGGGVCRVAGPHGAHLVITWPSDMPPANGHVLLVGHYDTALPAGTVRRHPFSVEGDILSGPGVYDMKGALVQTILAMRLIRDDGRALREPVRLVIVNDEEIGSPDGRRVVADNARGAIAAIGLEPALPGGSLKVGRRGVARARMSVTGRESHSGLDAQAGLSAIDELIDQLIRLRHLVPVNDDVALNVGTIEGGTRANVVPGGAQAELGLRFASQVGEAELLGALRSATPIRPGAVVKTEVLTHRPAWAADPHNLLAAELTVRALAMGLDLDHGVSGGAGDTNYLGSIGLPTVDGLGPEGNGAHSLDEMASLSSLLNRAALLADYLAPTSSTPDGTR